jgi:hypothetical protein
LLGSFTCRKVGTWDRYFYFPSEGRHAEDSYTRKNPTASAGFEPAKRRGKTPYRCVAVKFEQCLFLPRELSTRYLIINVGVVEEFVYAAEKLFDTVQSRFSEAQFLDVTFLPI